MNWKPERLLEKNYSCYCISNNRLSQLGADEISHKTKKRDRHRRSDDSSDRFDEEVRVTDKIIYDYLRVMNACMFHVDIEILIDIVEVNYWRKRTCRFYNGDLMDWHVLTFALPISAEIEKQLNASRPKLIFCTPEIYETAKQAASNTKSDIKIVCIKTDGDDVIPDGSIDFEQIIDINSKSLSECPKERNRFWNFSSIFVV